MNVPEKLAAIIRWVMRDVTYHKHYTATVMLQAGDNVDLLPDDATIRGTGLQGVPVDTIPGVKPTVPPGSKVTLYFNGGDPKKPRCTWVSGTPIVLTLAGGSLPVARVGDSVAVSIPATSAVGQPSVGTGTIVAGNPGILG